MKLIFIIFILCFIQCILQIATGQKCVGNETGYENQNDDKFANVATATSCAECPSGKFDDDEDPETGRKKP